MRAFSYDEAIQEQLAVGSGIIESAYKHVLQSRLKKSAQEVGSRSRG